MRPIPEAKRAQIVDALKVNPNAAAVARQIGGVSSATVGSIARDMNIDLGRSGPKKISAEKHALIIIMLKENPNASAIARELGGMSYNAVARIARKMKIKIGLAAQKAARENAGRMRDRPTTSC